MKNLVNALKAMADEPRMNILVVLASRGAVCVSHLQEAMRVPQPTVSRYLSILKNAGLLEAERRGQWVYYTLSGEEDTLVIEMIRKCSEQLRDTTKIKRIMDRLDKLEQQPSLPASADTVPAKIRKAARKPVKNGASSMANVEKETEVIRTHSETEEALRDTRQGLDKEIHPIKEAAVPTFELEAKPLGANESPEPGKPDIEEKAEVTEKVQEELDTSPKKVKRSKKQLPPSLFDL